MSTLINITDHEDLPCYDWEEKYYEECPIRFKWFEGEIHTCALCGNKIGYNVTEE